RRRAAVDFLASGDTVRDQLIREPRQPSLVVRHAEIFGRRQALELMARVVQILPAAVRSDDARRRIDAALPRLMEGGVVLLVMNRTHAVHAAHVVDAVHDFSPEEETFATPTIELRVTSAASCSSVICSVPAGRSGRTR